MHRWRVLFRVWRRSTQVDFEQQRDLQQVRYTIDAAGAAEATHQAWARKDEEWPLREWTGELLYLIRDDAPLEGT
jgi:hypothetical protein